MREPAVEAQRVAHFERVDVPVGVFGESYLPLATGTDTARDWSPVTGANETDP